MSVIHVWLSALPSMVAPVWVELPMNPFVP